MEELATNYAGALYELAQEEGKTGLLLQQLESLQDAFGETPAFMQLLSAPNISKAQRCLVLEDSFRDVLHPYLLNFLKLLVEKGHIPLLFSCCKVFKKRYYRDNGILPVLAETAVALRPEQSRRLEEKLHILTGKKVLLQNRVVPQCLGGVRLYYDGVQIDGTVQSRLAHLGKLLKNTVV